MIFWDYRTDLTYQFYPSTLTSWFKNGRKNCPIFIRQWDFNNLIFVDNIYTHSDIFIISYTQNWLWILIKLICKFILNDECKKLEELQNKIPVNWKNICNFDHSQAFLFHRNRIYLILSFHQFIGKQIFFIIMVHDQK